MMMYNPPHPGEDIRELYLKPMKMSVIDAAKALGVTRKTLSAIVNGRAGISADMAIRLSKVFKTTPELWVNMQSGYDLWHAMQRMKNWKPKVVFSDEHPADRPL